MQSARWNAGSPLRSSAAQHIEAQTFIIASCLSALSESGCRAAATGDAAPLEEASETRVGSAARLGSMSDAAGAHI